MSEFNSKFIKYLCLLIFLKGCAYFNTFYNAEEHFDTAERIRIENLGNQIPSRAIQEYGRAIEKSEKVLREYSDSRYVKDARLLKGKSHYFRREYDSAVSIFNQLIQEDGFSQEAKYWLALCKWRDLKPQPAINDLENLISEVESDEFKSKIFLSLGEIHLSIDNSDLAFNNFDKGANLSKNRLLREQVYFQIAEISFQKTDFDKALESYQKVLSNTVSITRIQDSNLKMVQIYRLRGELEKSANKIQELIIDEDFSSIKSDLDLELTKIEFDRGKIDFAIQNYDRIGKDYPNTQTAIESYYLLSEIYLRSPNVDFEKVQFFMNESMRQNTNSPIKQVIDKRRNDVDTLIKLDAELKQLESSERAENLFLSGQILAFNLAKYDESKLYFEEIIIKHQSSNYFQQSLFALYTINMKINNDEYLNYRDKILSNYPNSDFSKYIIDLENIEMEHLPSKTLSQAENLKDTDPLKSIELYKKVMLINQLSDSSKIASYFLGMYYDYEVSLTDSAKYYYEYVAENFPSSSQAKIAAKRLEVLNAQ
ncbi:MAG: tetratricopeptide repeat protein [Candidatus Neomarinimicrobiota bacterium]